MVEACEGIDTIVHLGIAIVQRGYPRTRYNQMIMETNIQGTYNIFEAARINKVPVVVVFASTNHVTGFYEKEGIYTTPDMPIRPDSMYGVSKAFGEALGRFYYDEYGISTYCLRIANYPDTEECNSTYPPRRKPLAQRPRCLRANRLLHRGPPGLNSASSTEFHRARTKSGTSPTPKNLSAGSPKTAVRPRRD